MIARIHFTGITKKDKTKSTLEDHVDIHVNADGLKEAREIFSSWTAKGAGIRGASGVFHPLNGYGDVKIKSVTEVTKTGASTLEEVEEEDEQEPETIEEVVPAKRQKAKPKEKEAEK